MIDADGSGELDADEFVTLYKKARGEKIKGAALKEAMRQMDADGSGLIEFEEFDGDLIYHFSVRTHALYVSLSLFSLSLTCAKWTCFAGLNSVVERQRR